LIFDRSATEKETSIGQQFERNRDREAAQAKALYEADAQAVRDKTVRLKALRLAKEAAELATGTAKKSVAPKGKKKPADPKAKAQPLSEMAQGPAGADGAVERSIKACAAERT